MLTIDFTSAKGKSLLDTVTRKFAPSRTGIQLLKYLRVKYLANHSFSKQQLLIDRLEEKRLASDVGDLRNPSDAEDFLSTLYGEV